MKNVEITISSSRIRKPGREVAKEVAMGHTAHQYDGETGDQLPQHIEQLGLQLLQRGHEGGIQLGQQLLQPGEKVSELRENIGGIERGNLLYQRRDGGP